jgi:hypothetical protein
MEVGQGQNWGCSAKERKKKKKSNNKLGRMWKEVVVA